MKKTKWISFGVQPTLDRSGKLSTVAATVSAPVPVHAKKFGLENFGNTCYANSVLQALYFCSPFRELLLQDIEYTANQNESQIATPATPHRRDPERKPSAVGEQLQSAPPNGATPIPASSPTLFAALRSLFLHISTSPGDKGCVAPRAFIEKLKELNELFRSTMHQDAHEFLNYLLNQIVEEIEHDKKSVANGEDLSSSILTFSSKPAATDITNSNSSNSGPAPRDVTLVHKLFEGVLTSETRCLTCETVSSRDESFLDLSIDIEQNSSVTACLRQFSASEMLCQKNKFFCDSCCDLQEAEKRMKIKKLPNVLALHLKRFKYQEDLGRYTKLTYRVAFPFELRLFNTVDDMDDADRLYNLFAIVVHIGNGPHHGHYISIIKVAGSWFLFDDDNVSSIPETDITKYFGESNAGSAYVLYYQAVDIDTAALGLRVPETTPLESASTHATPAPEQSPFPQDSIPLPPGLSTRAPEEIDPLQPISIDTSSHRHIPDNSSLPTSPMTPTQSATLEIPPSSNTPITPSSITNRIFKSVRKTPSLSAARAASETDAQRLVLDKSPRPSTSTPSFIAPTESSIETPPPVPPLPPNINGKPAPAPQMNDPETDSKEKVNGKEKEKKKGWFDRKRKSLRLGERDRSSKYGTTSAPAVPSPRVVTDDNDPGSSLGWFTRSTSSTGTPTLQRRPSEGAPPGDFTGLHPGRAVNGHDGSHSPTSGTSSPSSVSLLTNGVGHANGSTTSTNHPSTSFSSSIGSASPSLNHTPARKSSLVPVGTEQSTEWVRTSVDKKRSLEFKSHNSSRMSPSPLSTAPLPGWDAKNLPPLPPPAPSPSNHTHFHQSSNGYIDPNEFDTVTALKGKTRSFEPEFPQSQSPNDFQPPSAFPLPTPPSTTLGEPPTSIGSSAGGNNSTGSSGRSSSVSNTMRRATRKLSLTAPMLGFGKRDNNKR